MKMSTTPILTGSPTKKSNLTDLSKNFHEPKKVLHSQRHIFCIPLGTPVDPLVYIITARSSGEGLVTGVRTVEES